MKRRVAFPHSRHRVHLALTDPILLAGWLDVPYVSTGHGELHLFELEDWRGGEAWKVRGFIVENRRGERLLIEKDEVGGHEKPWLDLRLTDAEEGCALDLEWTDAYFDRTVRMLMDPAGRFRLRRLLGVDKSGVAKPAG